MRKRAFLRCPFSPWLRPNNGIISTTKPLRNPDRPDKNGVKKVEVISGGGWILPSNCKISEDGNKINIDVPQKLRLTLIRK
jgi:hypothetical protein